VAEIQSEFIDDMLRAVLKLKSVKESYMFFEDLCTVGELQAMGQRFAVAKMLDAKNNYQEVEKKTGASSATISRVNRSLRYGAGGYRLVLERSRAEDGDR